MDNKKKPSYGNKPNRAKYPNTAALLQKKHLNRGNNRQFFDSADWAGDLSKGIHNNAAARPNPLKKKYHPPTHNRGSTNKPMTSPRSAVGREGTQAPPAEPKPKDQPSEEQKKPTPSTQT